MRESTNLRLIESAAEKGAQHWAALPLTDGERIMLAFALLDRGFLPAGMAVVASRDLWQRLSEKQRWAIAFWLSPQPVK